MTGPHVFLVAGPTASGKSGAALALAEAWGAAVVNADALQVYSDLAVVTDRPDPAALARAPHHLYGHVDGAERYSTGRWLADAVSVLEAARVQERPVILVGGTGLYFKALTEGLAAVPDPGDAARAHARAVFEAGGLAALHAAAAAVDPVATARVAPADRQRLERILAVAEGAGRTLSALQADTRPVLAPEAWRAVAIVPDVAETDRRIGARAAEMVGPAGRAEAAALLARDLAPDLPVMKALGVRVLGELSAGAITEAGAVARLTLETRRYAKRQRTWLRNQAPDWPRAETADPALVARRLGADNGERPR